MTDKEKQETEDSRGWRILAALKKELKGAYNDKELTHDRRYIIKTILNIIDNLEETIK